MTSGVYKRPSVTERIANKIEIDPTTNCFKWQGAHSPKGYGHIRIDKKTRIVHRVVWELINGEIPSGLEIDHLCHVRSCVNINHLELVTHQENINRKRIHTNQNVDKTHCINGHEFTVDNTYIRKDKKGRECKMCRRVRMSDFKANGGVRERNE